MKAEVGSLTATLEFSAKFQQLRTLLSENKDLIFQNGSESLEIRKSPEKHFIESELDLIHKLTITEGDYRVDLSERFYLGENGLVLYGISSHSNFSQGFLTDSISFVEKYAITQSSFPNNPERTKHEEEQKRSNQKRKQILEEKAIALFERMRNLPYSTEQSRSVAQQ